MYLREEKIKKNLIKFLFEDNFDEVDEVREPKKIEEIKKTNVKWKDTYTLQKLPLKAEILFRAMGEQIRMDTVHNLVAIDQKSMAKDLHFSVRDMEEAEWILADNGFVNLYSSPRKGDPLVFMLNPEIVEGRYTKEQMEEEFWGESDEQSRQRFRQLKGTWI